MLGSATWREDEVKFRQLILYISQKCANDPTFGSIKLNKILFFSDFGYYACTGKPITGMEYQKLPNGPAPRKLLPIRDRMIKEGVLGLQTIPLAGGRIQKRTVNLREPDLTIFSGDEIALVDATIDALCNANAKMASELSHRMIGWIIAKDRETIPYSTVFLSNAPLSQAEIQRGRELADPILQQCGSRN